MALRPLVDLTTADLRIEKPGDITDLFAQGMQRMILLDTQLREDFFDLSSGFAGDVVQKCVNYEIEVAVVRTMDIPRSQSFEQFAAESTRRGSFVFVTSVAEACRKLEP